MTEYRRFYYPGGTWFFTVNLAERHGNRLLTNRIDLFVRDETDYGRHIDYIQWNPVKHGWVKAVKDWPHSSFHRYVKQGVYPENWGEPIELSKVSAGE